MTEKVEKSTQKRSRVKRKQKVCQAIEFNENELKNEILKNALVVKLPAGTADVVATKITEQVHKWILKRPAATIEDIWRRVAIEAKKYNDDLAYVYQNRGKII